MSTPRPPATQKRLPVKPSDENLRKQAKRRAKADNLQLAEAQHRVATEYGCRNWAELMHVVEVMNRGSDQLQDVQRTVEPLPAAVRARDVAKVRVILATGDFTQHDLDAGLAHAAWYGGDAPDVLAARKELFDLLLDYGADPDGQYGSAYGPIVLGTGECLSPDGLQWLIDAGCDVTFKPVQTKYGEAFPLATWLGTYERGANDRKHRGIEILLKHNVFVPADLHPAILAIHRGDVGSLARLIDADPFLPRLRFSSMPYGHGNMRLDGATLLHSAVEHGEVDCVDYLLDRWMEPNVQADVINGIGGQTPIFHAIATNQGKNRYMLEHLVKRLGYAIECHRIRATFRVYDTVFDTPMNPIEYAERASGEDTPAWRRATARDLELVRSVTWPGIKRKAISEKTSIDQFQEACRAGDFDAVKRLVESGDVSVEKLNLGIEGCALAKREDIARYLIDRGADINADYIDNYGPVLLGFCEGLNDEGVKFVLDLGARADWSPRPDSKYPHHSTPLRMTCETYVRGRKAAKHRILDMLITAGATPEDEVLMTIHRGDAKKLSHLIVADRTLIRKDKQFTAMFNIAGGLCRGTLLHVAVEQNEIECVDVILSNYRGWDDSDINSRAEFVDGVGGHSPLFLAARSWLGAGYPTLQWLVKRVGQYIDASVVATVREDDKLVEKTVLQYAGERERKLLEPYDRRATIRAASGRGDVATVRQMLDQWPELLSGEVMLRAVHDGKSLEIVKMLLDRGLDPNETPAPRRAIDLAAYKSLPEITDLLIAHGADVVSRNKLGETPLDLLDAYEPRPVGDPDSRRVRESLLKAGGTDDIHSAVRAGDVEEVRRMLNTDPLLVNTPQPWNPLFTAARAGRLEVARLLLERGAAVDGTNDKGNTPLWFACQSPADAADRIAVAELLLAAGANPRQECEDKSTPLHFAAWRGPAAMVELLIRHNAKTWQGDKDGKLPIDYARRGVAADKDAIVHLLDRPVIDDPHFRAAVNAIHAGDLVTLKQLLSAHPNLSRDRAIEPECYLSTDYFGSPKLLWFVANNPTLMKTMPRNIVEIAETIIDAGAEQDDLTYTLELVLTSDPARDAGLQQPLMKLLMSRGATVTPQAVHMTLGHRLRDAVITLLDGGMPMTASTAAGLGRIDDLKRLLPSADATEIQAALSLAVINDEVEAVRMCLAADADPDAFLFVHVHSTPAHQAAVNDNVPMLKLLVEHGARLDVRDKLWGGTPLGWAIHEKKKNAEVYLRAVEVTQ